MEIASRECLTSGDVPIIEPAGRLIGGLGGRRKIRGTQDGSELCCPPPRSEQLLIKGNTVSAETHDGKVIRMYMKMSAQLS